MCCLALSLVLLSSLAPWLQPARGLIYVNISGDVMLGGLFPVHTNGNGVTECGPIQVQDGYQVLEAMLFIIKEINENRDLLPGIKLGMIAYDTCDSPAYALEQSLDFIKGFIAHYNANEFHTDHPKEFVCADGSAPEYRGGNFDKVVALIGEQSSAVTMQIATMLRLFGTPIVSYMATSPALSNIDRFPTFFRTVPSDVNQAHAMLELIRRFNWTYVSIVYTDSEYGIQGYETLYKFARGYNVCFSTPLRVSKEHFRDQDYDSIVQRLANNSDARVVVVFAEKPTVVLRLVESTRRMKVKKRFVWVGSHGWTVNDHREHHLPISSTDLESHQVLEGALAIQPLASRLEGYGEYLSGLTLDNHEKVSPWFREYLESFFQCQFSNTSNGSTTAEPVKDCSTMNLTIVENRGFQQHSLLHFVRDAVYAVATALDNMHQDRCGNVRGLCDNMSHIENSLMVEYLTNVSFKDARGNPFKFWNGRDGPPRYSILNFQQTDENSFQWQIVGNYTLDENDSPKLFLDEKSIRFHKTAAAFPPSNCTQTCDDQQIKIRQYEDTCCWSCITCGHYEIRKDEFHCVECEIGSLPSKDKTVCVGVPEEYIHYGTSWAILALSVATVGIFLTAVISYVFWRNADTPVVKASGRELSYLLLLGTFLEFCVTYIMVAPPTTVSCVTTRFLLGFSFTLCYASIVTKTNRIARIFNNGGHLHKTRLISPISQVLITAMLTSVQIFVTIGWFWYDPPTVECDFPTRETHLRICSGLKDVSYLIGLCYPFILIGVCTVYAFLTRKCPDGFNEARHIGFTNYTAIVIWLAFVPLYMVSTSYNIRVVTLAMSLSLSGFVQLSCLFLPKIYIVVFTPEKNTKEVVMANNRTSSFSANTLSSGAIPNYPDMNFQNAMEKSKSDDEIPRRPILSRPNSPPGRRPDYSIPG